MIDLHLSLKLEIEQNTEQLNDDVVFDEQFASKNNMFTFHRFLRDSERCGVFCTPKIYSCFTGLGS